MSPPVSTLPLSPDNNPISSSLSKQQQQASSAAEAAEASAAEAAAEAEEVVAEDGEADAAFLHIHEIPISFRQDWDIGLGGGLWSTGLAMAKYLGTTDNAASNLRRMSVMKQRQRQQKRGGDSTTNTTNNTAMIDVLELGSGNGLLSVCLAALATSQGVPIRHLVITDTNEHLEMIRHTISNNPQATVTTQKVTIMEHLWGQFDDDCSGGVEEEEDDEHTSTSTSIETKVRNGQQTTFDLIIGSDVAYQEELYKPLIKSLVQFSHDETISLIGVTMADTSPKFFDDLEHANFQYEKLADHLLHPDFRGKTFGIFVIQQKRKGESRRCR